MNAIILSALLGVVMMFGGIVLKNKQSIVYTAIISLVVLLLGNVFETYGKFAIHVRVPGWATGGFRFAQRGRGPPLGH